ncbi:MAG: transcription antitermination factor NusB [Acidobacteria bacterium]|nr:MAG: transcription antitermination factor NusB [Acidobacteriota bacterium]
MSSRRKAREYALHLLFQHDLGNNQPEEMLPLFWKLNEADDATREFAEFLFRDALRNKKKIDQLIRRHALHWRIDRMSAVDRNILRIAVAEFLSTKTPKVVAIDEAIEIARKYSGDEATEFVNGVLDAIRVELEGSSEKGGNERTE